MKIKLKNFTEKSELWLDKDEIMTVLSFYISPKNEREYYICSSKSNGPVHWSIDDFEIVDDTISKRWVLDIWDDGHTIFAPKSWLFRSFWEDVYEEGSLANKLFLQEKELMENEEVSYKQYITKLVSEENSLEEKIIQCAMAFSEEYMSDIYSKIQGKSADGLWQEINQQTPEETYENRKRFFLSVMYRLLEEGKLKLGAESKFQEGSSEDQLYRYLSQWPEKENMLSGFDFQFTEDEHGNIIDFWPKYAFVWIGEDGAEEWT